VIARDAARLYLARHAERNLVLLGALAYDPLRDFRSYTRAGQIAALALVVDQPDVLPELLPAVMTAADDADALAELLAHGGWPEPAVWISVEAATRAWLEHWLDRPSDPRRGQIVFGTPRQTRQYRQPTLRSRDVVIRALTEDDADRLDMAPVSLSPTALRGWLRRGWRVFGALAGSTLVSHALAAYPIASFEEVAAVYTAPRARGQRIARAVVAMVIEDILERGRAPFYVAARGNLASQRVASAAGLRPIGETWEIIAG
jgi:GNAT superfamily N-acetyltransferase